MDAETTQTSRRVAELRLLAIEAAGPAALQFHPAWAVLLQYACVLMTAEQRRRLGAFYERLMREVDRCDT